MQISGRGGTRPVVKQLQALSQLPSIRWRISVMTYDEQVARRLQTTNTLEWHHARQAGLILRRTFCLVLLVVGSYTLLPRDFVSQSHGFCPSALRCFSRSYLGASHHLLCERALLKPAIAFKSRELELEMHAFMPRWCRPKDAIKLLYSRTKIGAAAANQQNHARAQSHVVASLFTASASQPCIDRYLISDRRGPLRTDGSHAKRAFAP